MATEAPTAPAAPKTPAPVVPGAPSAVPRAVGEIHVPGTPGPGKEIPAAAPDTAKGKLQKSLQDRANSKAAPSPEPREVVKGTEPGKTPEPKTGEVSKTPEPGKAPEPKPGELAVDDPKNPKAKPWKLVEEYKGRLGKAEAEILELRKQQPTGDAKELQERVERAESRAKELEKSIAFVDYSQTEEFKKTYQQPYESAWKSAMEELRELTVEDPTNGQARPINAQDMLQIVNAPLAKARQMADELFGPFANDIMAHRNHIRQLFDKQARALEDAKTSGLEKKKQDSEAQTKAHQVLQETVTKSWKEANDNIQQDERYKHLFNPREGDDKWNERLAKGYELVDKAFAESPGNPNMKPEERAEAIRRHAAVRHRAASWGALRGEVERLASENKKLSEELGQYRESEPGLGGDRLPKPGQPGEGGTAKDKMMAKLKSKAK